MQSSPLSFASVSRRSLPGFFALLLSLFAAGFSASAPEAKASTIQFPQSNYQVREDAGNVYVTVTVNRSGSQDEVISVDYATADGLAPAPGQPNNPARGVPPGAAQNTGDYQQTAGTLNFGANITSQTITIPIFQTDDADDNAAGATSAERFRLNLANPRSSSGTAPAISGSPTATIDILDVDGDNIGFSAADYQVYEPLRNSDGTSGTAIARLFVTRSPAGNTQPASVSYTTADMTATSDTTVPAPANPDYKTTTGTLDFPNTNPDATRGENADTFAIDVPVFNDAVAAGNKTFTVTLTPASGGIATATVTILDSDSSTVTFSSATYSVSESAPSATITLLRSGNLSVGGTVSVVTIAGTAQANRNYVTTSQSITFGPNETAKTFNVPIINDNAVTGTIYFDVSLSTRLNSGVLVGNAPGGTSPTARVNIQDAATVSTVEFLGTDFSVSQNDPTGKATITVRLNRAGDPSQTVTVQYFTSTSSDPNQTAVPNQDYVPVSGTLTFNPGDSDLKTFSVPVINNGQPGDTKKVSLNLANPSPNAFLGLKTATLSIFNANSAGAVQFTSPTYGVIENNGTVTLTASLNRTGDTSKVVSVNYATVPGSASQSRFAQTSGTLTFPAGSSIATLQIPIINDTIIEPPQTFVVVLSNPVNATLGTNSSTVVTIQDDDGLNTVEFSAPQYGVVESAGGVAITVNATRGGDPNQVLQVDVAFGGVNDTALPPNVRFAGDSGDYQIPPSTTLTFPAGVSQQTLTVPIVFQGGPQGTRSFTVSLVNTGQFTSVGRQSMASVTIFDTSGPNTAQFLTTAQRFREGDQAAIAITVVRFGTFDRNGTHVNYTTEIRNGDTATPGKDFITTSGSLEFAALFTPDGKLVVDNEHIKSIIIPVPDNFVIEGDVTFHVTLTGSDVAQLGPISTTQVTIADGDLGNVVQFSTPSYSVARNGGGNAVITVQLSPNGDASKASSVQYTATSITAFAGYDFSPVSGTLVFAPGETSKTFVVPINPNAVSNGPETFRVSLSNPSPGSIIGTNANATVTIVDNNLRNTLQFTPTNYTVAEGAGMATLTVSAIRMGSPNDVLTVDYRTMGGTAVQDRDYTGVSGTLTFAAGQTQQNITVPIIHNNLITGTTSFSVVLTNPSKGSVLGLADTATVNIADVDSPTASIGFSQTAFDANENGTAVLTVTRSGGLQVAATVNFSTNDGTALAGKNYRTTTGTVSFAVGEISKTISIPLIDDQTPDPTLQFTVNLTAANGTGFIGGQSTATVNIIDSDTTTVQFDQATYTVDEGAGSISLTVDAVRVGDPTTVITVNYATGDGTAAAPAKYTRTSGQLTFGSGVTQQTIVVPIIDEALVEGTTNFTVSLAGVSGGGNAAAGPKLGAPSTATVSIIDNDATTFQFGAPNYVATNSTGSVAVTVNLSRINDPNGVFTVDFATSDVSAVAGRDYSAAAGTLSFGAGETTKTIVVPIVSQPSGQPTRQFKVTLTNPSAGAVLGQAAVTTVSITNPDLSSKPVNISTRGPIETGDAVMIAGFIVQGNTPKQVLLRGRGPSLTAIGVIGAVQDTTLDLRDSNGVQLAFNDNWQDTQSAPISATKLAPSDPRESAILISLTPGNYTAILRGSTNGNGLVEVFDVDSTTSSRLINLSTRSKVEADDTGAMIGGFIIQGTTAQRVIIRAIGPSLKALGVNGVLADPTLELYRGSQKILANDNWKTTQQSDIVKTGLAPKDDKEAAILTTLDPGSYTAVVRGKNNTTGIALTEVYQLP